MIGKVAKCRNGMTGLILRVYKRRSDSITGSDKTLYSGVCLDPGRVGQEWQSIHPEVIGTLDDWVRIRHMEIMTETLASERVTTDAALAELVDTPTKRNLLT